MKQTASQISYYGTLGPSCQTEAILYEMFQQGMTGVRLNLSHIRLKQCKEWLFHLWKAAQRAKVTPQLLIDLQGPELRIGTLSEPIHLKKDAFIQLGKQGIPIPQLVITAALPGQELLLDDGNFLLRIKECSEESILCVVERGGILHSRKSMLLLGADLQQPTLTEEDHLNLLLAKEYHVTGVMLPFVRHAQDLQTLRCTLRDTGAEDVQVFAKIENASGVSSLQELLPHTDCIVIARGDLGNSMPLWELPRVQKQIARDCQNAKVPFMVVTQLLHSMQQNAVPTRAEVSDIFNAVLDGASSLMLTGETAIGDYPIEAMRYLVKTAENALQFCR